jgi:periplasmic divalent cation tolerance protein
MTDYIQVVTTTERREDAERIARTLVEERLAACVQVTGPITSTYRWQGQIETAQEWQCWAKSRRGLYDKIEQTIRRLHPYEVPEILAMPILAGSAGYLAWLEGETERGKDEIRMTNDE